MTKIREYNHLLHFRDVCHLFPDGEIECTEKPDFIVHGGDRILGIEHTEIFQPGKPDGTSLQAQDSLSQQVVNKASEIYFRNFSQPLLVQVLFNHGTMIRNIDVARLSNSIVQLIESAHIKPGDSITIKRTKENLEYFPREIIMLHVCIQHEENEWRSSSSGWIPEITPEYLQERIDQKDLKLKTYKSKCSELWLLIVADNLRIPSAVDLSDMAISHQYPTGFDRIFLFWDSSKSFVELKLKTNS